MRYYSSIATAKSLSTTINASATQITLNALPEGLTSYPYTLVLDPDTTSEEIVSVTSLASGTTLNVTRGQDGSTATSHNAGAVVKHMVTARDLQEPQTHMDATTSVHGISNTANLVTITGSQTLSNKDLTAGTNTFPSSLATLTGSQTLTNKTLTAPTVNNASSNYAILKSPEEIVTVSATAATGTINFDALTQQVLYYTSNASANFTLNFRGDGSNTLSSMLAVSNSVTVVFLVTNGATAYYPTAFQIDGSSVTPKWQNGAAPSAGNANSIDAYTFTIIKTAATPTYTVFAAQARFA